MMSQLSVSESISQSLSLPPASLAAELGTTTQSIRAGASAETLLARKPAALDSGVAMATGSL